MVTRNKFSDGVLFFRAWLTRPLQTAAFFPSSRGLAEAIVEEVPCGSDAGA
jgi:phospholipid N-methyltransferase